LGNDLETHDRGLLAQFRLCPMSGVFVALVENGLGVRLFGEQYFVEDTSDLVCSRSDCLGGPELRPHAPEEDSKVTLCSAERVGPEAEGKSSAVLYLARLAGQHLAPADSRFFGQRPSQEANADALRNLLTSEPVSVRMTWAVTALTPEYR
jgi:hypothetical protein